MDKGFKLIAIKPTKGCDKRFLKNLEEQHIYQFYNDYSFEKDKRNDEVLNIKDNSLIPNNLFGDNISVSAIVGKNGSGKSALIELFVASVNQFSFYLNNHKVLEKKQIITDANIESIEFPENSLGINAEIFFLNENQFYVLKIKKNNFHSLYNLTNHETIEKSKLKSFFYTLIINYSIYSFNPSVLGKQLDFYSTSNHWIDGLFHKNDSYQIPVVINPKRESAYDRYSGAIDINNEQDLLQQRLLFNILKYNVSGNESHLKITDNKKAIAILKEIKSFSSIKTYEFKNGKIDFIEEIKNQNNFWKTATRNTYSNGIQINNNRKKEIPTIFWKYDQVLIKLLVKFKIYENTNPFIEKCYEYLVYKTFSICEKYPDYQQFLKWDNKNELTIDITAFLKYIFVKKNRSHITNKLLQVIHFIKFYDKVWFKYLEKEINIIDLSRDLFDISKEYKLPLIELLPPPIFSLKIELKSTIEAEKDRITIDKLSSGEQQLIHSTSTIFYHLNNIISVKATPLINKYECVNLIFDEIELYFHPEYQRKLLKTILDGLKNNQLDKFKINILFVTHSPFILSDIPSQNILKLEDGKTMLSEVSENTFGANIHDLLANDFFLKNGFMGEFAKSEINQVINFLNIEKLKYRINVLKTLLLKLENKEDKVEYLNELKKTEIKLTQFEIIEIKVNKEYCKKIIELIGEPILSSSLMELFTEAYPNEKEDYISTQIKRLSNLIKKNDSDT